MLLEAALAEARLRNIRKVLLGTASVLEEAVALYRQTGFRPSCMHPPASRCDQVWELEL